jgi:hypothetical protein
VARGAADTEGGVGGERDVVLDLHVLRIYRIGKKT